MSATDSPRFVVTEFVGTTIPSRPGVGTSHMLASYYVQDTHNLWHVLREFTNYQNRGRRASRTKAERYCKRLNEWHEEECARG